MKLDFETLEKEILGYKAKSEYKQASILILRNIFKKLTNEFTSNNT